MLPALAKKHRVTHHKAMPFPEMGAFISKLRESPTISARCLEFTILIVARTNEAFQARPEEFDLTNAIWTIPRLTHEGEESASRSAVCPSGRNRRINAIPWVPRAAAC